MLCFVVVKFLIVADRCHPFTRSFQGCFTGTGETLQLQYADLLHRYQWSNLTGRGIIGCGPFYWHDLTLISAWIRNYIHYKVSDKLFIHSQTSMVAPLKFGMDKQFHPTLYWACDYLPIVGLKLDHVSKRGLWYQNITNFGKTKIVGVFLKMYFRIIAEIVHHCRRHVATIPRYHFERANPPNKETNGLLTSRPLLFYGCDIDIGVTQCDSCDSIIIIESAWWLLRGWCLFWAKTSATIVMT